MSIGQRIKYAREHKNLTMDEVAKQCKTTKQTIFKYENEIVTNIPYEKIVLLSKALDVSPSYLFEWNENENSLDETELTEGEIALIKLYRRIPKDRRKIVLSMIKAAFLDSQE